MRFLTQQSESSQNKPLIKMKYKKYQRIMNIEALDGVSETRSFIVNHLILYSGSDVALRTTRLQDKRGNRE